VLPELLAALQATSRQIRKDLAAGVYSPELANACSDPPPRPTVERQADGTLGVVPGPVCPDAMAIFTADRETHIRVINLVVHTAKTAGLHGLLLRLKDQSELRPMVLQ
jgi:hypothetical protein